MPDLTFRRYDSTGARAVRDTVAHIHPEAYTERIAAGDLWSTTEAFMTRYDSYTNRGGFDLVIAYSDDQPIGQTWGWPLNETTEWWHGLLEQPEPRFTDEDGKRTFALSEIMVRQPWTRQGVAHALHDELLSVRPETRATLLVRPEDTVAYRAYLNWGWRKAGQLRPSWPNAPLMDVLILPLPLGTP